MTRLRLTTFGLAAAIVVCAMVGCGLMMSSQAVPAARGTTGVTATNHGPSTAAVGNAIAPRGRLSLSQVAADNRRTIGRLIDGRAFPDEAELRALSLDDLETLGDTTATARHDLLGRLCWLTLYRNVSYNGPGGAYVEDPEERARSEAFWAKVNTASILIVTDARTGRFLTATTV